MARWFYHSLCRPVALVYGPFKGTCDNGVERHMRRNQGENDLQRQKETRDLASVTVAAPSSSSIGTHNTCLTRKKETWHQLHSCLSVQASVSTIQCKSWQKKSKMMILIMINIVMIDMMMIMTIVNLERDSTPIRADRSICTGYSLYLTLNAHCVSCDRHYDKVWWIWW